MKAGSSKDLAGYDAVIAISEDTLNSQLLGLYRAGWISDEMKQQGDSGDVLESSLGAPTLTLKKTAKSDDVILNLSFDKGTLTYSSGDTVDFEGMVLSFKALIGQQSLPMHSLLGSPIVPDSVKKRLEGLPEEDFDVEQLFLDIVHTIDQSRLTRIDNFADFDALKVMLPLIVQFYREGIQDVQPFGLGYVPSSSSGANQAGDPLRPTSIAYTITHHARQGWSTFNYVIMTEHREMPPGKPAISIPLVDSGDVQGRYWIAAHLMQRLFLDPIRDAMETDKPFQWHADKQCWTLQSEIAIDELDETLTEPSVRLSAKGRVCPVCTVKMQARTFPNVFDITFETLSEVVYSVDGQPGSLSPLQVQEDRFGGVWNLTLTDDCRITVNGEVTRSADYTANANHNMLYREDYANASNVHKRIRDRFANLMSGVWGTFHFFSLLSVNTYYPVLQPLILPLGDRFFFASPAFDGVQECNLRFNITYKE
ncbi:hypothetical protein PAECIP111893_04525 [Paenibacillus plantiphilus]|uniref:Uncharacterized protein n=1 Tax=Paenibacillus plantiphilus TaxID=2905650 RepID=A0ABM9CQ90_9BACL|nr:hypothetical protein [Paenibacillus plantiphilus]CAH1219240.1 hypothetical protein PAECIP111893_04525 [Paenibacillus plantiphilus]